jgi:hypothetical protein
MRVVLGSDVDDLEDVAEEPVRIRPAHVVHQDPPGPILRKVLPVLRRQKVAGQLGPGANVIKLFWLRNKLERFFLTESFRPSLIFMNKAVH